MKPRSPTTGTRPRRTPHGQALVGEVVVLPFPQTNLQSGKRRPALVVADMTGDDLILCQITSQSRSDGYSVPLAIADFECGRLFSTEKIFQAVTGHWGLQWENDMENVFNTWKNLRNPLAHGHERANPSEDDRKKLCWTNPKLLEQSTSFYLNYLAVLGR